MASDRRFVVPKGAPWGWVVDDLVERSLRRVFSSRKKVTVIDGEPVVNGARSIAVLTPGGRYVVYWKVAKWEPKQDA